jgi:hypothetical protein
LSREAIYPARYHGILKREGAAAKEIIAQALVFVLELQYKPGV